MPDRLALPYAHRLTLKNRCWVGSSDVEECLESKMTGVGGWLGVGSTEFRLESRVRLINI